jgi:hypothetical protein
MRSVVRNSGFSLKLLLLAGVFAFVSVSLSATAAEQRVALVIGNDAYPAAPLKNPVNDARAIAKSLNRLGFEVILRTNLNQKGMVEVLREFGGRLREGGVALFYYSGHGMQVKGRNYLIPVNSDIRSEDEVPYMSIDMAQVLDKIEAARSRANLVILDACRNNPFVRTFRSGRVGLAQMDAPGGTLLAFATAPGGVARDGNEENGIYTKHLLAQMNTPRLPVEVMFRRVREGVTAETNNTQTPWESSSLTGDFYFNQTAPAPEQAPPLATAIPGPQPAAPAARVDPLAVELAFWNSIKDSSNPADYTAYLEQYPAGSFAGIARNRTGSTAAAQAPPPVAAEPAPPTPPPATKGLNVASRAPSSAATRSRPTAVQVGDTWTYRLTDVRWNRNNATVVHEVLAVDAKSVTEKLALADQPQQQIQEQAALDARILVHNLTPDLIVSEFAPFLAAQQTLETGKSWANIPGLVDTSAFDSWRVSAKVVAREKVRVPAGEFDAFKVQVNAQRPDPSSTFLQGYVTRIEMFAWYAAQTRRVVKIEHMTFNLNMTRLDETRYELLSFKLN